MKRAFCFYHPETIAIERCHHCGKPLCPLCQTIIKGKISCRECSHLIIAGITLTPPRSPQFAAGLSFFFPGAGQVYNGQPGKGMFILLTCWLVVPWIYGIIDAYITADRINIHRIATRPSIMQFIGFVTVVLIGYLLLLGIYRRSSQIDYTGREIKQILMSLAESCEDFAWIHSRYPSQYAELVSSQSAALPDLICDTEVRGYAITCLFDAEGYQLTASPADSESPHSKRYTVSTRKILTVE